MKGMHIADEQNAQSNGKDIGTKPFGVIDLLAKMLSNDSEFRDSLTFVLEIVWQSSKCTPSEAVH